MIWARVQSFFWSFTWRSFPIVGSLCPPGQLVRMSPFIGQGWARLTQSFRRDFWPHQYMRRSFVLLNSWFAYETTFNTSIEGDKNIFLGRPTSVWKRENWNIPKPEKPRETGQNNREIPPKNHKRTSTKVKKTNHEPKQKMLHPCWWCVCQISTWHYQICKYHNGKYQLVNHVPRYRTNLFWRTNLEIDSKSL